MSMRCMIRHCVKKVVVVYCMSQKQSNQCPTYRISCWIESDQNYVTLLNTCNKQLMIIELYQQYMSHLNAIDPFQMWRQNLWTGGQDKRKSPRCNEVYYHANSNPLFCPPVQLHSHQLSGDAQQYVFGAWWDLWPDKSLLVVFSQMTIIPKIVYKKGHI